MGKLGRVREALDTLSEIASVMCPEGKPRPVRRNKQVWKKALRGHGAAYAQANTSTEVFDALWVMEIPGRMVSFDASSPPRKMRGELAKMQLRSGPVSIPQRPS